MHLVASRAAGPARARAARRSRRAPARRTTARKTAARRKPRPNRALASRSRGRQGIAQPALAGAALIPHAAVRTAGAVRDLSDSSLIVRLTARARLDRRALRAAGRHRRAQRGQPLPQRTSGRIGLAIEEYERQNSALRAELAEKLSAEPGRGRRGRAGPGGPAPDDVSYLSSRDGDVERLAALLDGDTVLSYEDSAVDPDAASLDRGGAAGDVQPAPRRRRRPHRRSTPPRQRPAGDGPAVRGRQPTGGVGL